jgi:hypothetical protein
MWMCSDLLILPVHIDSKSLLRETLNLRQKKEMFANGPSNTNRTCARAVIIREHMFWISIAVRQVFIVICRVHILLTVLHREDSANTRQHCRVHNGGSTGCSNKRWTLQVIHEFIKSPIVIIKWQPRTVVPRVAHYTVRCTSDVMYPQRRDTNEYWSITYEKCNGRESSELISQFHNLFYTVGFPLQKTEIIWWLEIQSSPAIKQRCACLWPLSNTVHSWLELPCSSHRLLL